MGDKTEMKIYKVELCNKDNHYKQKNQARTALRNHKKAKRCDCTLTPIELEENEWLCQLCNIINEGIKCKECSKSIHSQYAYPQTEVAKEIMHKKMLGDDLDSIELDEETIQNARGLSLKQGGE